MLLMLAGCTLSDMRCVSSIIRRVDLSQPYHSASSSSSSASSMLFTSKETVRTIRDEEPRTATSTFTQLLSSATLSVQCYFTSTETVRTIRDGEHRTATSTFTQHLSSVVHCSMLLYVHRDRTEY